MSSKNFNLVVSAVNGGAKTQDTGGQAELVLEDSGRKGIRKFQFEFNGDEKTYSAAFKGKIDQTDIRGILELMQNQLYKNCGGVILSYLEQHQLEYSCFKTGVAPLKHEEIMKRVECLLKSYPDGTIASPACNADNYYAVIDHQKRISENYCEGCYCALSRILDNGNCRCRIVGQIFSYDKCEDHTDGYFAIRTSDNGQPLRNIAVKSGEPVLPVFGCVDVTGLLLNIDRISTARQSVDISVR